MHFGADGKLYVAVGENAVAVALADARQQARQDAAHQPDGDRIPTDNPFFAVATGTNRAIWAMGLRNPFTFNVQPGTGRIFINDVGQSRHRRRSTTAWPAQNYGWPSCEGACPIPSPTPVVRPPNTFTDPLFQYANDALDLRHHGRHLL